MSEQANKDCNMVPSLESKTEISNKGSFAKPGNENSTESLEERERKKVNTPPLVGAATNGDAIVSSGSEVGTSEVEYIDSENLNDIDDANITLQSVLAGLESKEWVSVCESLNNVRRLCIFHKETMRDTLENVVTLVVKSLKNPRSAVCKTSIMTCADIFKTYGNDIIDYLDPMVIQLLLKSSQDKRFVCEAAEKALIALTTCLSPNLLLPKLQPYLKHKNPRIRAKASMCFSRSVPQLGIEGIKTYGIDKLIQIGATQLSDQLPESREAARGLLLQLQIVYEQSSEIEPTTKADELSSEKTCLVGDEPASPWETFCLSNLSRLSALAVLRVTVTNIARPEVYNGS
jgi:hypothetical protein